MLYAANARCAGSVVSRTTPWGTQLGQLDGPWEPVDASCSGNLSVEVSPRATSSLRNDSAMPSRHGLPKGVITRGRKIVTWLILPVVICLSQRLSHACLSISNLYCETANGSLNQLSFI